MGLCLRLALLAALLVAVPVVYIHQRYCVNPLDLQPVLLAGKTAVVTGGTDGIGKATARTLASWG